MPKTNTTASPGPNPQVRKGDLEAVVSLAAKLHVQAQRIRESEQASQLSDSAVSSIAESTGLSRDLLIKAQHALLARRRRLQLMVGGVLAALLIGVLVTRGWWQPLLFPIDPEARVILGESYRKKGKELYNKKNYVEAMRWVKEAIQTDPTNFVARNDLGLIFEAGDQKEDAKSAYRAVIETGSREEGVHWAYYNLARLLDEEGKEEEALVLYQKCLELRPDYAPAINNLGWVHEQLKHDQEALRYYQMAMDVDKSYSLARKNLAELKARLGRP